jgi:kinesin family protein 2/24
MMVERAKTRVKPRREHVTKTDQKINICVRKRPPFQKELEDGEIDCVSCANPCILVHECKYKVDGVTRTVENHGFEMDHTFAEDETTRSLYEHSIQP